MFQIISLIFPIAASILFFFIYQKAGFSGAILAFCAAPVLAALLPLAGWFAVSLGGMGTLENSMGGQATVMVIIALSVIGNLVAMLPLAILAFKTWPDEAA